MDTNPVVVVSHEEGGNTDVTVIEVVQPQAASPTAAAAATPESPESVVEEIIDAILDPFGDDETTVAVPMEAAIVTPVEPDLRTEWVAPDTTDDFGVPLTDDAAVAPTEESAAPAATEETSAPAPTEDPAAGEAQAHADAATEFQAKADEAVTAGDYAAASNLRESAENEAWTAGESGMLHGSDSIHLEAAAEQQQRADSLEWEEGRHAAAGEYEAARDDAFEAASATSSADFNAGGSDHTGQARDEYSHMDSAVFQEQWAKEDAQTADSYLAEGDVEHAGQYADSAVDHQQAADDQAALGEHGGDLADHDASSDVGHVDATDSYDSSAAPDTSSSYESPSPDLSSSTDDSSV
jgi:hypothetical protein